MKEVLNKKFWQDARKIFDEAKQEPASTGLPPSRLPDIQRAVETLTPEEQRDLLAWMQQRLDPASEEAPPQSH